MEFNLPSGIWVRDPNKKHFASICCAMWKVEHPNECGTEPMPLGPYESYQERTIFLAHTDKRWCKCTEHFHDEYTWVDDNLPQFDATQTCHKLNKGRVLMIGDSTLHQSAATLMNALFPAGCQTQLTTMYGDTFVGVSMGGYNRGINWVVCVKWHFTNTSESGIVILTAGAHVNNCSNFDIVMNYVIEGSKDIKQINRNIQIV